MGMIPEITCRRCRRKYSALRSKCPHCGTRKEPASSRAPVQTDAVAEEAPARRRNDGDIRLQMIFGGILVAAVIIAVIALVSFGIKDDPGTAESAPPTFSNETPPPTSPPPATPSPTPTVNVTNIQISLFTSFIESEFTIRTTEEPLTLTATCYPDPTTNPAVVEWRSTDPDILSVEAVEGTNGRECVVTAVSAGQVDLIASAGGIEAKLRVYVPA